jgi:exopolysaccharide biosynthesis polyprenyl glycosylphosphotransferase
VIKKRLLGFRLFRLVTDLFLIPIIFVFAYALKFKLALFSDLLFFHAKVYPQAQVEAYLNVMALILVIWIPTFYLCGMYRPFVGLMPEVDEFIAIVKGLSLATVMTMAITFLFKSFPESRYVIFYAWLIGTLVLSLAHMLVHTLELRALRLGKDRIRTLIIGADDAAQDIVERIVQYPSLGYRYLGNLCLAPPQKMHFHLQKTFIYLGPPDSYAQQILLLKPDLIIVSDLQSLSPEALQTFCKSQGCTLKKVSADASWLSSFAVFEDFDGIPLISYETPKPPLLEMFAKILMDYSLALIILILFSPILFVIAVLIKVVSPKGPILYQQERVGQHGNVFGMLKFRTMVPDAESQTGPVMVTKEDARYIPFGQFLRKTSIDELPQLINILKGEMSLVGPRPERPFFVDAFEKEIPHFHLRHEMKGGMTGWAQINGRAVLTNRPEHKIRYDLYYIKNWSFILDIKILIRTISVVFQREEAY